MNAALEVFGVSIQEVARLLSVSVSHVYRLGAKDESFPKARMAGGVRRYDPREVREWFDAQRVDARTARHAAGRKRLRAA